MIKRVVGAFKLALMGLLVVALLSCDSNGAGGSNVANWGEFNWDQGRWQ